MAFSISIKKWHGVAAWTWNAGEADDVCGICRNPYDGVPLGGEGGGSNTPLFPGDDSPLIWGVCEHAFHIQCINKWLASTAEQRCPMCRRAWEYKSGLDGDDQQPEEQAGEQGAQQGSAGEGQNGHEAGEEEDMAEGDAGDEVMGSPEQ